MWSGQSATGALCVMSVLMTSRANKAAFHGKKARANQRRFCACASVHAPTPWEGEKRKSAASAPVNPLAHSLVAGIQHQQPNQPSRSARFHRLLSSSPRLRNCSNRDSEGETRRSRRRSLSSSSCLFPLLMEGQRRPRFFKVLVGDFARRIEIPRGFLCHIPEERRRTSGSTVASSANVALKNAEGKTWPVGLDEIDGRMFLTTGWSKFVEGNCLRKGEFLVVEYDGNMHFGVSVFGVNTVEKAVWPSGSGAQVTQSLGEQPCDIFPSSKKGCCGDEMTETVKSPMHSHAQTVTTERSTHGDEHISSPDTIGFLDLHEVGCSKDELETCLSRKEPMEDDKAKAIAEAMRTLHVDKLAIELFCATLCLYKWKVEVAAEDLNICRGKLNILEQSMKQKLVLLFDFIKRQLQRFFPPDDDFERIKKNNLEGPNLSNQPLQSDLTVPPVKRRLVDESEPCDLSQKQKRKIVKLQRGSPQTQTPRRSPRLVHLNNTCNSTNKVLKKRAEVRRPPAAIIQVKHREHKSCSLHKKPYNALTTAREETTGSLYQDLRNLDSPQYEVGLSKVHDHDQGETRKMLDHSDDGKNSKEQMEINAVEISGSFLSTGCIESPPNNSGLTACSRKCDLSFIWKHPPHVNPLEKILLDIQRDNFVKTIASIQEIIRDDPSDVLSADVIEAAVRIGILKCDLSLQDRNAQKIVNALLEYSKKIKEKKNFNIEMRKEEFSAKLQDLLKWQLKELETAYTCLESDYKKAAADSTNLFSTLEEHRKKLHAVKDGIKDMQQDLIIEDEIQNLAHKVAEHETIYQKSILEKVRVKMDLKSYQQTLGDVKERLASTEPGSVDVEALVKIEMDNMSKEIQLSKGILLNINFKKE